VLKSKEPTSTRVNNRPVYKLTFEFRADDGGIYEVVSKTHLPHLLEDEAEEQLVYDPRHPAHAVMMDNLPGSPDIDEMGYIHSAGFRSGVLPLILPGLTMFVHGTVFLLVIW
jgi:flagellar basal body rod protein FlgC